MRYLKKLFAVATLAGILSGCYVEAHPHHYYAVRECHSGWTGYHCHYRY